MYFVDARVRGSMKKKKKDTKTQCHASQHYLVKAKNI